MKCKKQTSFIDMINQRKYNFVTINVNLKGVHCEEISLPIRGLVYHRKFRMVVLSIDINAASSGKLLFTSANN